MAIFFPTFDEIQNLKVKPEIGELYLLNFLKNNLDDSFEIFFNPFLNGDRPDVIIMKENQGVLIIEVKDYVLDSYELDERKNWKVKNINQHIKSPISQVLQYKENLFNLHIENLLAKKISNIKNFNIVSCAVYFHNATSLELNDFLVEPFKHDKKYLDFLKYNIQLIGRDDLSQNPFNEILKSCYLISNQPSFYFTNDIYKSFKRFLNPPYHFKEQVEKEIPYTKKQLEIIYGGNEKKEQRIKGVVGSGKTTVLAARAVQAVKRTDEEVLILTYNITLKNYIKDKISKVRENFNWKNFIILNYYVHISFAVKPLPKHKGILKQDAVNLFLLPCEDENGKQQVKVMCSKFSFFGHFYQLKNAELLDVNSSDEIDQHYLQKLSEAVEIICNEFEITTDKNQGKFVKQIKEDPTKLLEEFIEITHAKDFNDEEGILEFKHHWDLIQKNPEEYKEIIVDEGYFDEDAEIDTHHFTKYLLSEFLCAFDTDWKMDHEELSEFISEEIGQDFKITYEETKQKPSVIVEKIEKESDFTMLNIDTQMDSYSFFICKKSEKEKILELSRKLSFPIEDAF